MNTHVTDWNCRLLPRTGSSPSSVRASAETLQALHAHYGIDRFCMMPEWEPQRLPLSVFLLRRRLAFDALSEQLPQSIRLRLGATALLSPELCCEERLGDLTLFSHEYLALQFPICDYADWMDTEINRLLYRRHFKLFFTAFERCVLLYRPEILEKLMRIPAAIYQFNYRALEEERVCSVISSLLSENRTVLLGSGLCEPDRVKQVVFPQYEKSAKAGLALADYQTLLRQNERFWSR